MTDNTLDKFKLDGKVCVITGGAGFLGQKYARAILDAGGIPVIIDINAARIQEIVNQIKQEFGTDMASFSVDITNKAELEKVKDALMARFGRIDALVNNAANNPKVEAVGPGGSWTQLENFPEAEWENDLAVGLKGAFLCSQVFGSYMAENRGGVILNISSDLGLIAPDQRIYRQDGDSEENRMVKPVTYSVVKHGLIGLTRHLATYWAERGVRVNALAPGGVYHGHEDAFVKKLTNLIPLGRMAQEDEYKAAVIFLLSDASSYMTGSVLAIDGGRSCW